MEDSNNRRIHTSEITEDDCFYGFGEKSGVFNKAQKFMNMSPKDAMGYNPKETDSLYKHIPFYIKLNKKTKKAVGYFITIRMSVISIWDVRKVIIGSLTARIV